MKSNKRDVIEMLIILCVVLSINAKKISTNTNNNIKHSRYDQLLKEYIKNPNQFLNTNSNKDNFIAVFSNFTRTNGEEIYREFIENKYMKDVQLLLDSLNNFKVKYVDKWDYDSLKGRFNLPDEIRNYSDFYKWQMVIAIMRTMDTFPIIHKREKVELKNKNLRKGLSLVFPDDVKILDPPI